MLYLIGIYVACGAVLAKAYSNHKEYIRVSERIEELKEIIADMEELEKELGIYNPNH